MKRNFFASIFLLALTILGFKSKAQVSGYPFTQFGGTYSAITGGTVFGTTTSDDEYFVDPAIPTGGFTSTGPGMPIGFNFTFNGNTYDVFGISNNGWIGLGQSTLVPNPLDLSGSSYNPISSTSGAPAILQNKISALGRDLQGQAGSELRAETIGSAPNRTLVVQFTQYRMFASTGDSFDFQIRLSETTNHINVVYGTFTTTNVGSGETGLRGMTNSDFNNRNINTSITWSTSIAGTLNTALANFNSSLTPNVGQNYRWAPPALCTGVPNSGTASISSSTGCPNTTFTLNASGLSVASGLQFQWQSSPSASGPWTNIPSATMANFTTQVSSTTYFQIVTTCTASSQSATSTVVSYSVVNPGPCVCGGYASSAATSTADEEILNVTFGTLNSTSSCTTTAPGIGSIQNRYSNYTGFIAAPNVMQGQPVSFSLQIGTCGGNYNNSTAVYIDYNQNGSFLDVGEQAYLTPTATNGPNIVSGIITIPLSAVVGTTRMRVINVETSTPSAITPTSSYTWGETEDYCVNITAAVGCSGAPNSGTATISTPTACPNSTITLNATGLTVASGLTYQWQSAPSASGPWTSIPSASTVVYTTTAASTTYYQMVTTCTVSSQSATTSVVTFSVVNPGPCICNNYGSSGATSTGDEEIWNVNFGTLNNPSTCTTTAPGPGSLLNRYSNYAGFVPAPTVMQGQSVPFGIDINTCGGWYGMEFDIYIDYNQNGLFTDPGELAYNTTNAIQGNNTGNITIPITASVGTTRMRVVAVEGTVPGPTGSYTWGETEDYCINITAAVPCSGAPNSGTAAVSTPTGCISDVFNLNGLGYTVASGMTFQWQSAPSASGPWTNMPGGTAPNFTATAANLTFYQMVSTCTISALSATTSIISYTPSNCYTMTNGTITACGGTLYDSGGNLNNYQDNENYTLTIVPSTPNASVQLAFTTFSLETCCDYLEIYDGANTSAPLIGTYSTTAPPNIVATNSLGVLTLRFFSDGSVVYSGWSANITCTTGCTAAPSTPTINNVSICSGNSATLTSNSSATTNWFATSTPSNAIATGSVFITPALTSNTVYFANASNACGASSVISVSVTVNPSPTLNAVSSSSAVCAGSTVTLTASGMNTYTWSTSANTPVILVSPSVTTVYSVTATSTLCNVSQSATLSVGANANPTVALTAGASTICSLPGSIALNGSPSGGVYSGAAVTGSLLSVANPGTFVPVYTYTDAATGCFSSASATVIVANCTGIDEASKTSKGISVYPNPNSGAFIIESTNATSLEIDVLDMTGRVVYSERSTTPKTLVNIEKLANGIYQVRIKSENSLDVIKVIKQ